MRIVVLGGGITGQLVQLAEPNATIFDWKPQPRGPVSLTRQFGGNYLWEPIADLPCREFRVITEIDNRPATSESILAYKKKVFKADEVNDPNNNWANQFRHEVVGYDFQELPPAHVEYGYRAVSIHPTRGVIQFDKYGDMRYDMLVSTIPLYSLLSLCGIPEPFGKLLFKFIYVKVIPRVPDAPYPDSVFYVNYLSDPAVAPYRYADRWGERIPERHYESLDPMGSLANKRIQPGKIYPHPGVATILEELANYKIFTFGRYGSWNPEELIHETWHNIENWKEMIA